MFSGYSGWDGGQLEVELAVDSWFIVEAVADDVFGDPTDLWSRVSEATATAGSASTHSTPTISR